MGPFDICYYTSNDELMVVEFNGFHHRIRIAKQFLRCTFRQDCCHRLIKGTMWVAHDERESENIKGRAIRPEATGFNLFDVFAIDFRYVRNIIRFIIT